MGRDFFKVLSVVAFVASFFIPGGIFVSGGFLGSSYFTIAYATILRGLSSISATIGFAPELPNPSVSQRLAEELAAPAQVVDDPLWH